jgi:hypothetical protein
VQHLLRVVPVLGILNEKNAFKPAPNPDEVESVFDAPLEMFIKVFSVVPFLDLRLGNFIFSIFETLFIISLIQDEIRRSEEREWMECKYLVHFFDYETENKKYLIWGLTAGILIKAASVVLQQPPAFVEQNPIFKVPRVIDKDTAIP